MSTFLYQVELEQDEDGRWSATIPELPGCSTWGHNQEEAVKSLQEAAIAYLNVLAENGKLPQQLPGSRCFYKAPVLALDIKLTA